MDEKNQIRTSTPSLDDEYVENSTGSNIEDQISTYVSYSQCTISLYVLRQADLNDTWKIQAVFDNDNKYTSELEGFLTRPKVSLENVVDIKHNYFCLEQITEK
jgi:hypothetical protein